jgi:hypothetical protein
MFRELLVPLAMLFSLVAINALLSWLAIVSINGLSPPPRYTTRGLLITMTIVALILGLFGAAIHAFG